MQLATPHHLALLVHSYLCYHVLCVTVHDCIRIIAVVGYIHVTCNTIHSTDFAGRGLSVKILSFWVENSHTRTLVVNRFSVAKWFSYCEEKYFFSVMFSEQLCVIATVHRYGN